MGDGDGLRRGEKFIPWIHIHIGHAATVAYVLISGQAQIGMTSYSKWVDAVCIGLYRERMTTAVATEFIPQLTMGDRLRCIRRNVQMGQLDFARELGVKGSTYGAWETGRNAVADEVAIAKRVQLRWGVPAWWTLGLEMQETPTGTDPSGGGGCAIRDSNPEPAGMGNLAGRGHWHEAVVVPLRPTGSQGDEKRKAA